MTYCAAIRLKDGIVLASDTRTNAGVDHVSTFKKLFTFGVEGKSFFSIQTAGNLATSQAVIKKIERDITDNNKQSLYRQNNLFDIANIIGDYTTLVAKGSQAKSMRQESGFGSSFLLSGQIGKSAPNLYLIYSEGNCMHATEDTPFLQIGESKYGKPILDRAIDYDSSINDAIRALLVSFDSTIRSNLSVGYPIDLLVYHKDSLKTPKGVRLDTDDKYLNVIRNSWSDGLLDILHGFDLPPDDYQH